MKLRNKKTGEIGINEGEDIEDKRFCIRSEKTGHIYVYDSLAELNEEWEDYEPKEPLIKDEKARKAVRAWAEANGVERVIYKEDNYRFLALDTEVGSMIEFENMPEYIGLKDENEYTIAELCGEEEE